MRMLSHFDQWMERVKVAFASTMDDPDDIPLQFKEIEKASSAEIYTTRQVNAAFGVQREEWRQALEQELNSFKEKGVVRPLTDKERSTLTARDIYPMKVVASVKPEDASGVRRKRARGVVCGNYEPDGGLNTYCSNLDVASLRSALAIGTAKGWSVGALDISVAFLNADLPLEQKRVVVRPPAVMVKYGLVDPKELWVAEKAIYGLRVSPKAWSD